LFIVNHHKQIFFRGKGGLSLYRNLLCLALFCCSFFAAELKSQAQTPSSTPQPPAQSPTPTSTPPPQTKSTSTLERNFFKNVLHDQAAIWTSPFSLHGKDALRLAPFIGGTALLIATDRPMANRVDSGGSLQPFSRSFSHFGSPYWTSGVAAAFYLVGRARHDQRARETGLLSVEALVDGLMVIEPIKFVTQRPRPLDDTRGRGFFSGGYAFPSGHSMSAWAVATVIANEYGERRPLVRISAYGLASAVSLSRYGGRRHYLSDTFVGSLIGYGIGHYVFFKHHDRNLDLQAEHGDFKSPSKLWPAITPSFQRDAGNSRQYGMTLAWNF
jgi:membrane-associated phospholipid phosphatase